MNAASTAAPRDRSVATSAANDLLNTAERLFAERGIENVALTRIVAASRQRSRTALHEHFGSRGGLLMAVLDRRLAPLNARRQALLDALPKDAAPVDIVRAAIAPLGHAILEEPWGADHAGVLSQVICHPTLLGARPMESDNISGLMRAHRMVARVAAHVPQAVLAQRLFWLTDSVVLAMAHWSRDTAPEGRTEGAMIALIDHLAAYGAAGLTAPAPAPREEA